VLVHVQRDERRRVPDGERVLRVTDVVEEALLVPVVGRPSPTAPAHAGRLQVGAPRLDRAEVALDQGRDATGRVAAPAAQVLEVDLMVLDAADGEGQVDLERAHVRVHLVRGREVDFGELAEDLVPLRHIPLVELVVRFDGRAGDAVHLEEGRLELPGRDLLVVLGQCRHRSPFASSSGGSEEIVSFPM
jgi:hypothetical protein